MKLYKKSITFTQGSSYLSFIINEKDKAWLNKDKVGPINTMLLSLFEEAYPLARIEYAIPPFLSDKGIDGESLLLINVTEWSSLGGKKTDELLRTTFISMLKNKVLTKDEANNLLEECGTILSIPSKKIMESISEDKQADKQSLKDKSKDSENYCGFKKGFYK